MKIPGINKNLDENKIVEKEARDLFHRRVNEFEIAWKDFFKGKSQPKTDEEDVSQMKEFSHWYNHVRKQSDTNLTPKEMSDKNMENRMFEFREDEDDEECADFGDGDEEAVERAK
ncbi:hypothetical protein HYT23_06275 [Candidatus Pacearchaeota archaeon]|nr:hypothetical protein [Candidatus Pacearchaeota archaeon]